jgi:hypothetical protein
MSKGFKSFFIALGILISIWILFFASIVSTKDCILEREGRGGDPIPGESNPYHCYHTLYRLFLESI